MGSNASCRQCESILIPEDKIGVCGGWYNDEYTSCEDGCECYWVDREWEPNLQDYTTFVLIVVRCRTACVYVHISYVLLFDISLYI